MIRGYRTVPDAPIETTTRACARCGVIREARKNTVLCTDCRSVLAPAERKAWAA